MGRGNSKVSLFIKNQFKSLIFLFDITLFLTEHKMSKTSHQSFEHAAKAIRDSDKDTDLHKVTKEQKLKLYSLYKQATEGDCKTSKPQENVQSDQREKCDAWCKMKGKSKESAEKQYVELARTLLNKYGASKYVDF